MSFELKSNKSAQKTLLIDGHAMAFRAFHALKRQNLTNTSGMPTETIFGFFRMMAKLIRERKPGRLLVVFDPEKATFRHRKYAGYKANRPKMPDELKLQIDEIKEILNQIGLEPAIPEDSEADDLIASIAKYFNEKDETGGTLEIVSGDKDLFPILAEKITLLRPQKGVSNFEKVTPEWVQKKYQISHNQFADLLAIMGDSSDNIPGIKGIGEKGAIALLLEYRDFENILKAAEEGKIKGAIAQKIIQGKEGGRLSQNLVALKTDLEIPEIPPLHLSKIQIFSKKGFASLFEEFSSLTDQKFQDSTRIKTLGATRHIVKNEKDWKNLLKSLSKASSFAFDTETTSFLPLAADLLGVSIAWEEKSQLHSLYMPLFSSKIRESKNFHESYSDCLNLEEGRKLLKPIFESKQKKIAQNAKYDFLVLFSHGIKVDHLVTDTMLLSYLLDPALRRHNLDDLAEDWLQYKTIHYKDLVGRKNLPLFAVELSKVADYAMEDAETTYLLANKLEKEVSNAGLTNLYKEIDLPLLFVLAKMERSGILLDREYLKKQQNQFKNLIEEKTTSIYKYAEEIFKINSTKELARILFEKLKIPPIKKTPKGSYSTDAQVLEELRKRYSDQYPIIEDLLSYRQLNKLLNTYIEPLPEKILPQTGRVHTSFSQAMTATGRLSSDTPNLQNIPIKGEEGRAIRRAFIAKDDFKILVLDYNQIELRILAHYSEDKNLLLAYKENQDIHDQATYYLFGQQFDPTSKTWSTQPENAIQDPKKSTFDFDPEILTKMKETKEFRDLRSYAKILNFSIVYGVTDFGLARNLGISREYAKHLIEAYFKAFPQISVYMKEIVEKTKNQGYSTNLFGRRRKIEGLEAKNRFTREGAGRLAINNPIQSTAADIIKKAMIQIQNWIEKENLRTQMLLQIHDELLFEVPTDEKEKVFEPIKSMMENVVKLKVPLVVAGAFGKNWGDGK